MLANHSFSSCRSCSCICAERLINERASPGLRLPPKHVRFSDTRYSAQHTAEFDARSQGKGVHLHVFPLLPNLPCSPRLSSSLTLTSQATYLLTLFVFPTLTVSSLPSLHLKTAIKSDVNKWYKIRLRSKQSGTFCQAFAL